jgi:hypothetical protein
MRMFSIQQARAEYHGYHRYDNWIASLARKRSNKRLTRPDLFRAKDAEVDERTSVEVTAPQLERFLAQYALYCDHRHLTEPCTDATASANSIMPSYLRG